MKRKETKLQIAFRLGFMMAGEGYNGEYPFDRKSDVPDDNPLNNKHWRRNRDKQLRTLLPKRRKK